LIIFGDNFLNPSLLHSIHRLCKELGKEFSAVPSTLHVELARRMQASFSPAILERVLMDRLRRRLPSDAGSTSMSMNELMDDPAKLETRCREILQLYKADILQQLVSESGSQGGLVSPEEESDRVNRVVDAFELADLQSLGHFILLVDTPPSKDLKTDLTFISEHSLSWMHFTVQFQLPPAAAQELGLQSTYVASLKLVSAKLPIQSIISQLSYQLKFDGQLIKQV
jgi:hypothetical protein